MDTILDTILSKIETKPPRYLLLWPLCSCPVTARSLVASIPSYGHHPRLRPGTLESLDTITLVTVSDLSALPPSLRRRPGDQVASAQANSNPATTVRGCNGLHQEAKESQPKPSSPVPTSSHPRRNGERTRSGPPHPLGVIVGNDHGGPDYSRLERIIVVSHRRSNRVGTVRTLAPAPNARPPHSTPITTTAVRPAQSHPGNSLAPTHHPTAQPRSSHARPRILAVIMPAVAQITILDHVRSRAQQGPPDSALAHPNPRPDQSPARRDHEHGGSLIAVLATYVGAG